jgi:hypothetical protein
MAVEILACSVIAHRGPWVCMAGGDLDVAERNSGIEHGGDVGVTQHVGVHSR